MPAPLAPDNFSRPRPCFVTYTERKMLSSINPNHERALALAQEAETRCGNATPDAVIARAKMYLGFLLGASDAPTASKTPDRSDFERR